MKLGENALHVAVRAISMAQVQALIHACATDAERDALINAKSVEGKTPLMLAAMAGGVRGSATVTEAASIARLLLQSGARANPHSKSRRSAADYATEHGKPQLAEECRRIAALQLSSAAAAATDQTGHTEPSATAVIAQFSGESATRCAICGDRLGRSKFLSHHEAVQRGEESKALVADFFAALPKRALETLSLPVLHCLNNRRSFTRELTEALAMLSRLHRIVEQHGSGIKGGSAIKGGSDNTGLRTDNDGFDDTWHVIDLCCGKAFFGTLVGVLHPSWKVHCVDKQPITFLPHFEAAGLASVVEYAQLDVLAPGFVKAIRELIDASGGRRVVIFGMHLCGLLAMRAIRLLRKLPQVAALVLSPCCLPAVVKAEGTPHAVFAGKDHHEQYDRWCSFLQKRMHSRAELIHCEPSSLCAEADDDDDEEEAADGGGDVDPSEAGASAEDLPRTASSLECTRECEPALVSSKNTILTAVRSDTSSRSVIVGDEAH